MNRFFVPMLFAVSFIGCTSGDDPVPDVASGPVVQQSNAAAPVSAVPAEQDQLTEKPYSDSIPDGWVELQDANNQYTIVVPKDWGPISPDALAAQGKAVSGPNMKIDYIAGYQVLAADLFVHPFILVRKLPARLMPKHKIRAAQALFEASGSAMAKEAAKQSGLNVSMTVGVPVLDEATGIVWLKSELDGPEGLKVEGLAAHYYVGDSIFQFNAGTISTQSAEDWPILRRIVSTVRFKDQ